MSAIRVVAISENPSDFPGRFVARLFEVRGGHDAAAIVPIDPPLGVALSLDEARAFVPSGLVRFPPDPDDDPAIVEVWL